jgi:hypothetical protein
VRALVLATRGRTAVEGACVWKLKDWIDRRRFVNGYNRTAA